MSDWILAIVFSPLLSLAGGGAALAWASDPAPRQIEVEGWPVKLDPRLEQDAHADVRQESLKALANHLQRIRYVVPPSRLAELQTVPIWLELDNAVLAKIRRENMQYHPDAGWLRRNGLDPRLAKHVHVPRAEQLYQRATWEKHPYVVLHELAHAFHDQFLGFDHPEILAAFDQARRQGGYEEVLPFRGRPVQHYALSDHKEYFAESVEAFFGVNDFYPFVRAELREHDERMHALLMKIWRVGQGGEP